MHLAKLPARLIILPAELPLTEAQAGESKIVARAGMGGIGFNRLLVGSQGLRHPAQIEERVAAVGRCGPAAEKLGMVKDSDGLGESALAVKQDAVHVDGFSVAGVTQKGPAEPRPGAGEILLSGAKLAPGNEGLNLCGVEGECSAEVRLSPFRPALFALENRKVDPAGNEVWTQLDGAMESRGRPSILPAIAKQAAETDPGSGEVRTQGERAAVTCFSFLKPAKAG
jgi:hypothetical protein